MKFLIKSLIFFISFYLTYGLDNLKDDIKNLKEDSKNDFLNKKNPFRIQKINLLWEKSQNRLGVNKLKNLYDDLKEQDKLELVLKKFKSESQDKNGLKEMETRSKLNVILAKYDLKDILENHETENIDHYTTKQVFKDKNLDKLWKKAEKSHFTEEELKILKEEFQHHEKKINEYHKLIDKVHEKEDNLKDEKNKWENSIEDHEEQNIDDLLTHHHQSLNDKHKTIKKNFINLQDKVLKNFDLNKNRMFEDDDAEKLWQAALKTDLEKYELDLLKGELEHFQQRIKKINYLHEQTNIDLFDKKDKVDDYETDKFLKTRIKDLTNQVEKLRNSIQSKIMQRHTEL